MTSSEHPVLLHQALRRGLAMVFATVATIALLMVWFQHTAMDKSSRAVLASMSAFYSDKIILLEQEWQEAAIHLHASLEFRPLFDDPARGWTPLRETLAQERVDLFPMILVTAPDGRVLFDYHTLDITVPTHIEIKGDTGWFEDPRSGRLFRWIVQPLWLGKHGEGRLVLFVAMDNAMLYRNTLPLTDLFLTQGGRVVASSLGSPGLQEPPLETNSHWLDGVRHDQITLPWSQQTGPRLVISHHSRPLFSNREILLAGAAAFAALSLLFWQLLAVWIMSLARRISTLGRISREFTSGYQLTQKMELTLQGVKESSPDEVATVAEAMAELTRTVVLRTREKEKQTLRLQESEERFRGLTNSLADAIVVFDHHGHIHYGNPATATMFGMSEERLHHFTMHELFAPRWVGKMWRDKLIPAPDATSRETMLEGVARRAQGEEFPMELSLSRWQRKNQEFFTAIIRDVSAQRLLEARDMRAYVNRVAISALLEIGLEPISLTRKLEVALEIILTVPWLAVQRKGSIFLARDNILEMMVQKGLHPHLLQACKRIPSGYCLCGRVMATRQIVFSNHLDTNHDVRFDGIAEHGHYCVPILMKEHLLGVLNLYVDHLHAHDPEEEAFLTTIANTLAGVVERGLVEERVHHLATHDTLTGLPNRMLFRELLEQELRHARRQHQTLAVGFLDLDHFKEVNDTLGHETGDLLLKAVAGLVRHCLRESDTLARLGGDEFTLILPNIGDHEDARAVAGKIVHALGQPIILNGHTCQIGASIGIALFPDHATTGDDLLQQADQAMYLVKKSGKNGYTVYEKEGGKGSSPRKEGGVAVRVGE